MADYRGEIIGAKGAASRLGSKKSGLKAMAHSWRTRVEVDYFMRDNVPWITITAIWLVTAEPIRRVIYSGPETKVVNALATVWDGATNE